VSGAGRCGGGTTQPVSRAARKGEISFTVDVFGVHQQLITDYEAFTSSLVNVRNPEIQRHLDGERERKARWPDPRIWLNPNFRNGGTVAQLSEDLVLHPECRRYFRHKKDEDDSGSRTLSLHHHQREALEAAASGGSYVLTTGTGSGKSLAYILPIVHDVLSNPNPDGISAIVVYPTPARSGPRPSHPMHRPRPGSQNLNLAPRTACSASVR
jgi:hypothetical protein